MICCDKTGTLTQNLMMATEIAIDGKKVEVSGVGYRPQGEFVHDGQSLSLEAISHWHYAAPSARLRLYLQQCQDRKKDADSTSSAIPPKARWFVWPRRPACAARTSGCI